MNLEELKEYHNKLEGKRSHLQEELEEAEKSLTYWKKRYDKSLKARIVIQTAAKETQSMLEQRFSNIVTLALRSIPFPSNYEFLLEIVERRNKTEVDKWFVKNGEKLKPLKCSGGGACNIASIASLFAFWSLNPTQNSIFLDEPFRDLSINYQSDASEMLNMLTKELNLQIVMVSHNEDIIAACDNLIKL